MKKSSITLLIYYYFRMNNNIDTDNDNFITSIVEDGMNSSYIDSLLIALFYKDNKNLCFLL